MHFKRFFDIKGTNNNILIIGYGNVNDAKNLINKSKEPYKLIKGFWENNKK